MNKVFQVVVLSFICIEAAQSQSYLSNSRFKVPSDNRLTDTTTAVQAPAQDLTQRVTGLQSTGFNPGPFPFAQVVPFGGQQGVGGSQQGFLGQQVFGNQQGMGGIQQGFVGSQQGLGGSQQGLGGFPQFGRLSFGRQYNGRHHSGKRHH